MLADLDVMKRKGAKVFSIGKSVLGTDIPALMIGRGNPVVLMHAGLHAREHVASKVLMRHARAFQPQFCRMIIVPMANPDGVRIATEGTSFLPQKYRDLMDKIAPDPRLIKCNARGVDLNVNFDARWGQGKQNTFVPGPQNYVGPYPESEPETVALVHLTHRYRPVVSISWHAKGGEVYWRWGRNAFYERDFYEMAGKYAESAGYVLADADGSAGGYKDWFIQQNFGMGLTVEVGKSDLAHHDLYQIEDKIFDETKEFLRLADEHANTIYRRRIYEGSPL